MLHGNAYYYPLSRAVPAMRLVLVALLVLLTLIPGMTFSPVQTVPAGKGQISTANSKAALASNNATNSPTLGKEPIAPKVGSPEEMPQGLYQTWMQTQNLEAANDSTYRLEAGTGEVQGHNPSQGLELSFQSGGVTINGMNLSLTRIGYQGQTLEPLAEVAPVVTANRVEYQRGTGLTEWYINKAEGLEQGFTLTQAWPGQNGKELILELSLTGGLFRSAGDALTLVSDKGNSTRYGGLYVYDATGQALTSRMEVSGEGQTARILVNLDGAQYPLVIDPLVQQQLLTASDGAASDNFGWFVSLSSDGNTALIGAYQKTIGGNTLQGAAYIFVRTLDGSWTQQGSALTANDGAAGDGFGNSVSLSSDGNTALIGANFKTIGAKNRQGAAYIFVRTLDGNWTQQGSALTANDGAAGDCFGVSVSLTGDGNIAIVGAPYKTVGMNSLQGEAYIFVRSGTTWILQQSLIASDGTANNRFGFAVSLSSDGNTALIGASNKAVGMNSLQGEAYIFVRSGATWILQQPLIASDGAANDWFGNTVSLSSDGNTSLIGAYQKTIGGHGQQGAAYIFVRSGTTWTQQQELTASDGTTSDLFGNAVSLSKDGKTALIGAQWSNSRQGTAYIFKQSGATWTLQQRLTPKDGAANDWFGFAVSLSMDGNTALISSPYKNFQGAAYTFTTQYTTTTLYTDDFSTYPLGSAPTGWVAYGLSANVPTIVNYGGTGKQFQRLTFATSTQATSPSTGSTPVESEYRDYIIKDNLILTAPTVSVKLNINANSGGEGMFLAWQDPLNFISILTDPYFGEFVIWQAVNGNYGAIGGTGRYNLPITLGQDYWIKAQTTTTINGTPKLDVYWSTDGINYTLKASANPASVAGRVGIGHFRGYVPTYFDDFTVSDAITSSATNHPPTANAGGPYNVVVSQTVTLNGSGSDPDGDPLTFAWDLDNNGSFETPGQNVSFSAIGHSLGSQTVGLQVCDNQGACTTTNTTINILTKSTTKIALTGRVLDKAGNGVPGQTIQLSGSVSASTITDPSGNYTLQVAAGNYTLKVSGNNASYLPIPSYYDLTLNSSLNLTQDTILDLPLPIKKISVHVQNQAGTSVANTAIWTTDPRLGNLSMGNYAASGVSYYAPWTNQVTTDASGNADIWLFPSTTITYLFAAVPPSNMLDVVKTEFPGVSVINDTSIVITLNPAPTKIALTGRVLDKAGNGVPRQTVQLSGSGNDSTTTDPSGNYTLRVAAGNYTLKVSGSNASYLPIPSYYDLTLNSSLNLTQDTILDLPLPIKKISVHVQNQAGTSVANTAIWTTDPRLGNLSMGNYTASGVSYYAPWTNQVTTDASGNADIWLFPSTTITYLFAAVPPSNMLDVVKTEFPGVSVINDTSIVITLNTNQGNHPPTANAGGPYSVVVSQSVTLNGSGSDPDNDPLTFKWDLDNNGSFETTGQSVNFSAVGLSLGDHTVALQVCDNQGACATAKATVTVLTDLRIVTDSPLPNGTLGQAYSVTFQAAGGTPPYTWSYTGNLPSGLNLDPNTGVLSGTPTAAGTFGFSITVTDSNSTITKQFTFFQHPSIGNAGYNYNVRFIINPTSDVSNPGNQPPPTCSNYTVTSGNLPPGLNLDQTGVISGTPLNGGSYSATIGCLINGGSSTGQTATKDFTITINNPLPTLTSLDPSSTVEGGSDFTLTLIGTNFVISSTVQWNGTNLATTYLSASKLTAVVPASNIAAAGSAKVKVVNPDPVGGTSGELTFTINPKNRPPTASAGGPYSVDEGSSVTLHATASDPDNDPLTITWDFGNGDVRQGQDVVFAGSDGPSSTTVGLKVCDDKLACVTTSATVNVINVNPKVTPASNQTVVTNSNAARSYQLGSFADPGPDSPWTVTIDWGDSSALTTFNLDTIGSLGSQPHAYLASGNYTVKVTVKDKDGGISDPASFTINFLLDTIAPTTTTTLNPTANAAGWNKDDLAVTLKAVDNQGGSGVQQIVYSASGAQTIALQTVLGDSASFPITAEGETIITFYATDKLGNQEVNQQLTIRLDKTLPVVKCASPDGLWHKDDLALNCTTSDGTGSGINPVGDQNFTLHTSVAVGSETANAQTDSKQVCDLAGNCVTAGPIAGIKVDKREPVITLTTPVDQVVYLLNQKVKVDYSCSDGGSGVASCAGPVASGGKLDTSSVGVKTFTVTAKDKVGNTSTQTIHYTVAYAVCTNNGKDKGDNSGKGDNKSSQDQKLNNQSVGQDNSEDVKRTIPITIWLCDAAGDNVSSDKVKVIALDVDDNAALLNDSGKANPDNKFRYEEGKYLFNLNTKGLKSGTHTLHLKAGDDPTIHDLQLTLK